jgi:hypothetical protein
MEFRNDDTTPAANVWNFVEDAVGKSSWEPQTGTTKYEFKTAQNLKPVTADKIVLSTQMPVMKDSYPLVVLPDFSPSQIISKHGAMMVRFSENILFEGTPNIETTADGALCLELDCSVEGNAIKMQGKLDATLTQATYDFKVDNALAVYFKIGEDFQIRTGQRARIQFKDSNDAVESCATFTCSKVGTKHLKVVTNGLKTIVRGVTYTMTIDHDKDTDDSNGILKQAGGRWDDTAWTT